MFFLSKDVCMRDVCVCPDVVILLVWLPLRGNEVFCPFFFFFCVYCELQTNKQVNYCYYIFYTDIIF